jgi:hypothetical protein
MKNNFVNGSIYFASYSEEFPDFDSIVISQNFSIYRKTNFSVIDPIKDIIQGIEKITQKQITFDESVLDEFEELSIDDILNLEYLDISNRFDLNFFNEVDIIDGTILNEITRDLEKTK